MAHKPYNKLAFTNSVPKFLQSAYVEHGIKNNSLLAKKFVSEDADNGETDESALHSLDEKPERLDNGDRKDTDFEKPVIMNVEQIKDLNLKQREQLNDIMRKRQMNEIKNVNSEHNEDDDIFIAKKVMTFSSVPSQNVIGFETKRKAKSTRKRALLNHENQHDDQPSQKKRKIYQNMSTKQLKKQRKKKLKFKTDNTSNKEETKHIQTQKRSMLSFDVDED